MKEATDERVRQFQQLVERDHEREVAMFQQKADSAAAEGDEHGREHYQRLADRIGAIQPPWKQRTG